MIEMVNGMGIIEPMKITNHSLAHTPLNDSKYCMPELSAINEWFSDYLPQDINLYVSTESMGFNYFDTVRNMDKEIRKMNEEARKSNEDEIQKNAYLAFSDIGFLQWCSKKGLIIIVGSNNRREEEIAEKLVKFCKDFLKIEAVRKGDSQVLLRIEPQTLDKMCFHGDICWSREEVDKNNLQLLGCSLAKT